MGTVVRSSSTHGKGLFAVRDFAKGEKVEDIDGEIVARESNSKYAIRLPGRRSLLLKNKTKYVNHSSEPNVSFNIKRCQLVAIKEIKSGEELFSAYESVF